MNAQVKKALGLDLRTQTGQELTAFDRTGEGSVIRKLPFEAVYQLYFAPDPTPEQIARELFLLDCD